MNQLFKYDSFIAHTQYMKEFCYPLRKIGIDYLSYTRVYADGGRIILSTNPRIIENYFSTSKYTRFWNEGHSSYYKSGLIMLWKFVPHQDIFQEASEIAGIKHGIYLFGDVNDDYYESFGFATTCHNESIINAYLNNLNSLKNFTEFFKESARSMLKKVENCKVILPLNKSIITLPEDVSYQADSFEIPLKLTKRQQQCAFLVMKGMTAKVIARELALSFRTVETYLQDLKAKLNCKNKTELILKLTKSSKSGSF